MSELPNTFELEALDEFLFHLPEMRARIPSLRVEKRERDARGFWTTFACAASEPEWSMSLDSEIILPGDTSLDAELWSRGEHPWRLRVWDPSAAWSGDVSGYRFVSA